MNDQTWRKRLVELLSNRLLWVAAVFCLLFIILSVHLFNLQIVRGEEYRNNLSATTLKVLPITAPRGNIYDCKGRPLAVNTSAYTIKIDPSVTIDNQTLYDLVALLEKNGEQYVDDLPISADEPYQFTFPNKTQEARWKADMQIADKEGTLPAEDTFAALRTKFKLPAALTNAEARKVLNFRCMIYMQRYTQYLPVTIAYGVKEETVAVLEEENAKYAGIYVDTQSLRSYPEGPYFSHILGYIGKISDDELNTYKDQGVTYLSNALIGKTGIERAFESDLSGVDGTKQVEVTNVGRQVREVDTVNPVPGSDVFLTLDASLQEKAYNILQQNLTDTLCNKIAGTSGKEDPITSQQVLVSMVQANNISMKQIMDASPLTDSYAIRQYIMGQIPYITTNTSKEVQQIKDLVCDALTSGDLRESQIILAMRDQNIITGDSNFVAQVKSGALTPTAVILQKLQEGEITPQMTNLDPCTGSVVVVDVKTGGVLAAASYPSFDNNQLANNFNNAYYSKLMADPTNPILDRPFMEQRAPGSTFKMVTAIAGLNEGIIAPATTIHDDVIFTKAGAPYSKNWSTVSNGDINVKQALEVSCNYFFCEVAYEMGNQKAGTQLQAIATLDKYMKAFGLNDRSGVEIGELDDTFNRPSNISSPELKDYKVRSEYAAPTKTQLDWYDGDTVRTAYGQGFNSFTAATMAKYVSILANRGLELPLHLMSKVQTADGQEQDYQIVPETKDHVDISATAWDTVQQGMLMVTQADQGLATKVFRDFPVQVAGKTGTAQENANRNDHSSFAGYAPADDPQVAIYVMVPFGDTKNNPAAVSSVIAKAVLSAYFGLDETPAAQAVNGLTQ